MFHVKQKIMIFKNNKQLIFIFKNKIIKLYGKKYKILLDNKLNIWYNIYDNKKKRSAKHESISIKQQQF